MEIKGTAFGLAVAGLLAWQGALVQPAMAQQASQGQSHQAAQGQQREKVGTAGKAAAADASFMEEAAAGSMMEVELGRLAQSKAANPEVRQFGQRMIDDHGKAGQQLQQIARDKGVTLPNDLPKKQAATKDRLEKLSGAEFDRAYMQYMLTDHRKDVEKFKQEARQARDPEVKSWAAKTEPVLDEHLQLAREVAKKVGVTPKEPSGEKK